MVIAGVKIYVSAATDAVGALSVVVTDVTVTVIDFVVVVTITVVGESF